MAVTVVLTPVLQKSEKCQFYQEIGGCYKGTIILKNSVPIRRTPFKCIFVRIEKALMRGKNEREISVWSIGGCNSNFFLVLEKRFNHIKSLSTFYSP